MPSTTSNISVHFLLARALKLAPILKRDFTKRDVIGNMEIPDMLFVAVP